MQANAVFAIFLGFAGVCMIESFKSTEEKCPSSLEDRQLAAECLNKIKDGNCDFMEFLERPDTYLNEEEKRDCAICFAEGKNIITKDGQFDEVQMDENIDNLNTTDEIKGQIKKAHALCVEKNKDSAYPVADALICTTKKGIKICSSNTDKSSA